MMDAPAHHKTGSPSPNKIEPRKALRKKFTAVLTAVAIKEDGRRSNARTKRLHIPMLQRMIMPIQHPCSIRTMESLLSPDGNKIRTNPERWEESIASFPNTEAIAAVEPANTA